MQILADENIPFVRDAFSHLGDVRTLAGRAITAESLQGADCLLVRSVTKVDTSLVRQSGLRFVASATAGIDHVDQDALKEKGIEFAYAPGSNATSVAEYVMTAMLRYAVSTGMSLAEKSIGVIGVGNVGSRVEKRALALGMRVIPNDPPLAETTGDARFRTLEEALEADFVTLHVPLTKTGPHATFHLAGDDFFRRLKPGTVFINAARGAVHDTAAVIAALDNKRIPAAILDVWEGEPTPSPELARRALVGTPHIAGYSFDGKVRGTEMIYEAACRFFGIEPRWSARLAVEAPRDSQIEIPAGAQSDEAALLPIVLKAYDLPGDDQRFRPIAEMSSEAAAAYFTKLRKEYPKRREFENYSVAAGSASSALIAKIQGLGFRIS